MVLSKNQHIQILKNLPRKPKRRMLATKQVYTQVELPEGVQLESAEERTGRMVNQLKNPVQPQNTSRVNSLAESNETREDILAKPNVLDWQYTESFPVVEQLKKVNQKLDVLIGLMAKNGRP